MAENIFDKQSFVVITGASKGIGKAIALKFSKKLPSTSVFLLLARSVAILEDVKKEMQSPNKDLKVFVKKFDQGNLDQNIFDNLIKTVVAENEINIQDVQQAIIVHNAAVLGDVTKLATQLTDATSVRSSFDINVSGMILLNSAFFQVFSDSSKSRLVVNISSDNTKVADPTLSLYCAGKAARDMYFRVMVVEDPTIRVLTYNPGAVDTEILAELRDHTGLPSFAKEVQDTEFKMAAISFDRKSFVVITGASKGLGKCIATTFAAKYPSSSAFLLLSRDLPALDDVKKEITTTKPDLKVIAKKFDQANLDQNVLDNLFADVLKDNKLSADEFGQSVLVHNAAIVGDVKKFAQKLKDVNEVKTNVDISITGMILLNSSFLQTFSDTSKSRLIINMSSAAAVLPTPTLSLYCLGKAARDMFFSVLAAEDTSLRILSYAPGFVDTDLLRYMRDHSIDERTTGFVGGKYKDGEVTSCGFAINKLVEILEKNTFANGAHVDITDKL